MQILMKSVQGVKMKKIILSCLSLMTITVVIFLLVYLGRDHAEELPINKESQNEILQEIKKVEAQEEIVRKWVNTSDYDGGFVDHPDEEILAKYKNKKGVVEYLFATVLMDNPELFIQAFNTETISKDLFKDDEIDKKIVAQRMMDRISRNKTLVGVGYTPLKGSFGAEKDESKVILRYKDDLEVSLELSFVKGGTAHAEDDEIYSVSTSAWDMIDQIESH